MAAKIGQKDSPYALFNAYIYHLLHDVDKGKSYKFSIVIHTAALLSREPNFRLQFCVGTNTTSGDTQLSWQTLVSRQTRRLRGGSV